MVSKLLTSALLLLLGDDIVRAIEQSVETGIKSPVITLCIEETNYLSNAIGSGSTRGQAVFFGNDAVIEVIAMPEEIRYEEQDFGRDKKLAWLYLGGFARMWDFTTESREHIWFLTSA